MVDCKCLNCEERFTCDFALSVWAAKSRMMDKGVKVRFITYDCSKQSGFDFSTPIITPLPEDYPCNTSKQQVEEKWKCPKCGSTETVKRGYSSRHPKTPIGVYVECCKGCNTSISLLKQIYNSSK